MCHMMGQGQQKVANGVYHINHESHKHEMKGTFDDDVDDHACDDPREGKHNTAIKQKLKALTFYKQVIRN